MRERPDNSLMIVSEAVMCVEGAGRAVRGAFGSPSNELAREEFEIDPVRLRGSNSSSLSSSPMSMRRSPSLSNNWLGG